MPPCICMEKGESLDIWMRRTQDGVDMITGLQVLGINLVKAMCDKKGVKLEGVTSSNYLG